MLKVLSHDEYLRRLLSARRRNEWDWLISVGLEAKSNWMKDTGG